MPQDLSSRAPAAEASESVELDERDWPILHAADPCDGVNPATKRSCALGYHKGYHRDSAGAEWLDEE